VASSEAVFETIKAAGVSREGTLKVGIIDRKGWIKQNTLRNNADCYLSFDTPQVYERRLMKYLKMIKTTSFQKSSSHNPIKPKEPNKETNKYHTQTQHPTPQPPSSISSNSPPSPIPFPTGVTGVPKASKFSKLGLILCPSQVYPSTGVVKYPWQSPAQRLLYFLHLGYRQLLLLQLLPFLLFLAQTRY
jgi:hypothetical protein